MKFRFIFLIIILILLIQACDQQSNPKRKIKLSDQHIGNNSNRKLTTTIYLEPKERRSIAVMFFQNLTGDDNLQWLQKGLTEMFIRSLSQSRSISVLSMDSLFVILNRLGNTVSPEKIDLEMAAIIAREANVEVVLRGDISKSGDSLKINIKLQEPSQGMILKETSAEGSGLENIFAMVDNLTEKIKNDLQLSLDKKETSQGIAGLTTNSLESWKHYAAGIDFKNKYLLDEAVQEFQKAIAGDENFVAAYLNLCGVHLRKAEHPQAYEVLQKLQKLRDKATSQERYQIDLFDAAFNNDAKKYIAAIKEWLNSNPDDLEANYTLAELYQGWNNVEQAIVYFKNIIKIDPNYKLAYNRLGYMYANTGDYQQAINYMNTYKALAPDESNPYDSSGEINLLYGNYKDAERDFKSALKINEKFAYSIRNLGQVYLEKGDYKKALATYKKYLKKAPDDAGRATAYDGIARTFMRLGQRDSVTANFQKSLELNMFDFVPIELLNDLYLEQGDTTRSQTMLQETYGRVKKIADSGIMRMNATFFLTWLALFGNVNREETIEIVINEIKRIEDTPALMADKLNLANLKFFLTMLYIQTNQDERIEALWPKQQDVIPEEFWPMLKGVQNQTYSTNWRAYTILNKIFYRYFERGLAFYEPLIKYTSEYEVKPMEMMFRLFLADLYLHVGKVAEADGQRRIVGMLAESTWLVIGPFDNKDGFRKKFPPEKKIELDRAYKEKSRELTWQPANDGMEDGFINLKEIYKPYNWSVAYGLIDVESPEEKEVQFRFGTDDGCKVWLNEKQIWGFNQGGPAILDDNKVNVKLKQGRNKILIKVCNTVSDWGFFFRVTDKEGNGVADVRFVKGDE